MEDKSINWEKIGIYIAVTVSLLTVVVYIADMKERIATLETKLSYYPDPKVEIEIKK